MHAQPNSSCWSWRQHMTALPSIKQLHGTFQTALLILETAQSQHLNQWNIYVALFLNRLNQNATQSTPAQLCSERQKQNQLQSNYVPFIKTFTTDPSPTSLVTDVTKAACHSTHLASPHPGSERCSMQWWGRTPRWVLAPREETEACCGCLTHWYSPAKVVRGLCWYLGIVKR